jgi:hypothetical protein
VTEVFLRQCALGYLPAPDIFLRRGFARFGEILRLRHASKIKLKIVA